MVKTPLTMLSRVSYSGYKYSSDNMAGTRVPFAFTRRKQNPSTGAAKYIHILFTWNLFNRLGFIVWWGANKAEL